MELREPQTKSRVGRGQLTQSWVVAGRFAPTGCAIRSRFDAAVSRVRGPLPRGPLRLQPAGATGGGRGPSRYGKEPDTPRRARTRVTRDEQPAGRARKKSGTLGTYQNEPGASEIHALFFQPAR